MTVVHKKCDNYPPPISVTEKVLLCHQIICFLRRKHADALVISLISLILATNTPTFSLDVEQAKHVLSLVRLYNYNF